MVTHRATAVRSRRRKLGAVFKAIADPTRREILDRLAVGPRRADEIADAFPVSRPAISRHLRVLRGASLVHAEKHGRERIYYFDPRPLAEIDAWLTRHRLSLAASLVNLKKFIESSPSAEEASDGDRR